MYRNPHYKMKDDPPEIGWIIVLAVLIVGIIIIIWFILTRPYAPAPVAKGLTSETTSKLAPPVKNPVNMKPDIVLKPVGMLWSESSLALVPNITSQSKIAPSQSNPLSLITGVSMSAVEAPPQSNSLSFVPSITVSVELIT